jgi:hypothetical protein
MDWKTVSAGLLKGVIKTQQLFPGEAPIILTLSLRIGSMHSKRCFNRLAISLFLMIFLFAGAQLAICQDSAKTWKDNATGLLWSVKDNESDINWVQAGNYCKNLALEGHKDWRLPTVKELETIYDKRQSKLFKAKEPIELTGESMWAEATGSGEAWTFNFLNGGTSLLPVTGSCGGSGRALCVRQSGK